MADEAAQRLEMMTRALSELQEEHEVLLGSSGHRVAAMKQQSLEIERLRAECAQLRQKGPAEGDSENAFLKKELDALAEECDRFRQVAHEALRERDELYAQNVQLQQEAARNPPSPARDLVALCSEQEDKIFDLLRREEAALEQVDKLKTAMRKLQHDSGAEHALLHEQRVAGLKHQLRVRNEQYSPDQSMPALSNSLLTPFPISCPGQDAEERIEVIYAKFDAVSRRCRRLEEALRESTEGDVREVEELRMSASATPSPRRPAREQNKTPASAAAAASSPRRAQNRTPRASPRKLVQGLVEDSAAHAGQTENGAPAPALPPAAAFLQLLKQQREQYGRGAARAPLVPPLSPPAAAHSLPQGALARLEEAQAARKRALDNARKTGVDVRGDRDKGRRAKARRRPEWVP